MLKKLPKLPSGAGVYFFLGKKKSGEILYVGKAANLKKRVGSYFSKPLASPRLAKLLENTVRLSWRETKSEVEALILESQLIKKHRPPFNVALRDDKRYFYVGFSNDKFPKIFITHQPVKTLTSNFIGPFTDGTALKMALRLIRRFFPYCACKQKHNNYCLNYHIGKCLGFCCLKNPDLRSASGRMTRDLRNYKKSIEAIKKVLSGQGSILIEKLTREMNFQAKKEDFKKATDLRNRIEKLKRVFENARIISKPYNVLPKTDRESENGSKERTALRELAQLLKLPSIPRRIEGYDVANIQGKFAVGAMVVFTDGLPNRSQYRKFKIKTVERPDDIAMLQEVLIRRFNHPEWPRPNLIIVDGGRAQFNTAKAVVDKLGTTNHRLRIITLTKNEKHRGSHVYIDNKKPAVPLSKLPPDVRNLILQTDAEAHRSAIGYYRKLHKSLLTFAQ